MVIMQSKHAVTMYWVYGQHAAKYRHPHIMVHALCFASKAPVGGSQYLRYLVSIHGRIDFARSVHAGS